MSKNQKKRLSNPLGTKLFSLLLKVGVSIGLFYALYVQLVTPDNAVSSFDHFKDQVQKSPFWVLALITALVPINLMLEAYKFKRLLEGITMSSSEAEDGLIISFGDSVKRVLAGLSVGLFTPNRVGEYAGRLTGTIAGQRSLSIIATLIGGMAQQLPLVLGGLMSIIILSNTRLEFLANEYYLIIAAICALFVGFCFYRSDLVRNFLARNMPVTAFRSFIAKPFNVSTGRFSRLWQNVAKSLDELSRTDLYALKLRRDVLLLSVTRYVVYVSQLSLAFIYCGLEVPGLMCFAGTAFLLFSQSFIPLPTVLQALARVQIGLIVWTEFSPDIYSLTAGSMLIFVLNLGIPSLLGLIIILRSDVAKTIAVKNA